MLFVSWAFLLLTLYTILKTPPQCCFSCYFLWLFSDLANWNMVSFHKTFYSDPSLYCPNSSCKSKRVFSFFSFLLGSFKTSFVNEIGHEILIRIIIIGTFTIFTFHLLYPFQLPWKSKTLKVSSYNPAQPSLGQMRMNPVPCPHTPLVTRHQLMGTLSRVFLMDLKKESITGMVLMAGDALWLTSKSSSLSLHCLGVWS